MLSIPFARAGAAVDAREAAGKRWTLLQHRGSALGLRLSGRARVSQELKPEAAEAKALVYMHRSWETLGGSSANPLSPLSCILSYAA